MVEKHYGHLAPSYIADAIRAGAPRFCGSGFGGNAGSGQSRESLCRAANADAVQRAWPGGRSLNHTRQHDDAQGRNGAGDRSLGAGGDGTTNYYDEKGRMIGSSRERR
jgi:hypothetical protein